MHVECADGVGLLSQDILKISRNQVEKNKINGAQITFTCFRKDREISWFGLELFPGVVQMGTLQSLAAILLRVDFNSFQ